MTNATSATTTVTLPPKSSRLRLWRCASARRRAAPDRRGGRWRVDALLTKEPLLYLRILGLGMYYWSVAARLSVSLVPHQG